MPALPSRSANFRAAAIDLGGSSGRVVSASVGDGQLRIDGVRRFRNRAFTDELGLRWDAQRLHRDAIAGLRSLREEGSAFASVGVDAWSGDYGLLGYDGLVDAPFHQRDSRTDRSFPLVEARLPAADTFRQTGVTALPIMTIYQLMADQAVGRLDTVRRMLLIPDLISHWLGGEEVSEATNVSSTGLALPYGEGWDTERIDALGLPAAIFPGTVGPGTVTGRMNDGILAGGDRTEITAVASHDTASAVIAVPAENEHFAYVSCGTWILTGVEVDHLITSERARAAGFTNELGLDGTVRLLRIAAGLWIVNECMREWGIDGWGARSTAARRALIARAEAAPASRILIDTGDPRLLRPGQMTARIAALIAESGGQAPTDHAAIVRLVLESLGAFVARQVEESAALSGVDVRVVHLVGGGSESPILAQAVADRSGRPVQAGPSEATSMGNILVQARTHGAVRGGLSDLRRVVRASTVLRRYEPRPR
ncbi:rhamnulokinase [Microbacterium sp. SA39]|uniref:rhamnulokinase n=1 Tax=Microbacterium sp. SA39 TaxID=1263625 RepID=UPI0005F9CFB8|nr:FGGY-family carbohydrate kinase [Microbacterium sp. SA39]KJQ53420.1 Rhamnulokinase [Microbacterium sp. SA39]